MLARNGGGALVNVLSVLSWLTTPGSAGYAASKAAAWSLTNATRGELRDQGTLVVGVHVGYLDTDMTADITAPKSDPADLVGLILKALENNDEEVLGDDLSRHVKSTLSGPAAGLAV